MASPASPADSGSAAAAAAEQPLTLLHLPGELLAHIACFLDVDGGACERLCLAATCRTLLAASRQQPSWWRRLGLVLRGSSRPLSGFAGISAWLAKHRPGIAALSVKQEGRSSSLPAWDLRLPSPPRECAARLIEQALGVLGRLAAWLLQLQLEPACASDVLTSCVGLPAAVPSLVDLKLQHSSVSSAVMAGLMAHTSLTRLALLSNGYPNYLDDLPASISNLSRLAVLQLDCSPGKLHRLAPLSQLRGLELGWVSVAQEWEQLARTLPHLRPLTSLLLHSQLHDTERRLPDTLTLLTSLAAVQLVCFAQPGQWAPVLAAAAAEDQRLTRLVLERCSQQLQEIPAELASLTALQHLTIKVGRYDDPAQIVGGLQHLAGLPLTHLALERCEAVLPPQASTLTALRNLSLSCRFPAGAAASPARIPQLGTGAQLQFLALLQCPMPPAGPAWQRLSSLGHLTRLEVQQAEGQEWPAALASLTALKELWLGDAFWGNGSWQLLAGLCQLTRMELPLGWRPSAADMQLSNCPPALLHLTVRGVTRELQPAVARHSSLTHLVSWRQLRNACLQRSKTQCG